MLPPDLANDHDFIFDIAFQPWLYFAVHQYFATNKLQLQILSPVHVSACEGKLAPREGWFAAERCMEWINRMKPNSTEFKRIQHNLELRRFVFQVLSTVWWSSWTRRHCSMAMTFQYFLSLWPEFESQWRVSNSTNVSGYACNLESMESRVAWMVLQMDIFAAFFGLDDSDDSDSGSEAQCLWVNWWKLPQMYTHLVNVMLTHVDTYYDQSGWRPVKFFHIFPRSALVPKICTGIWSDVHAYKQGRQRRWA